MTVSLSDTSLPWAQFLAEQRLPAHYQAAAEQWFAPLVSHLIHRQAELARPLVLGINGCQGSGKSTLAALLEMALPRLAQLRVCVLSIDDFYRTHAERQQLGRDVHPLWVTRGVPGTHDTALFGATLDALMQPGDTVAVPRFDKSTDDRCPRERWSEVDVPVDVVIWEGWCLGIEPQSATALAAPINPLEREQDSGGGWRRGVNSALADDYQPLFDRVDVWAMLAAPGFECVYRWRCEQEQKLRADRGGHGSGLMSDDDIARFIQYYQRLTEHALSTLPAKVDFLYSLDEQRAITSLRQQGE